jgi:phage I-like protein
VGLSGGLVDDCAHMNSPTQTLSLNATLDLPGLGAGVALNFEGDAPPKWVQLVPAGERVTGNDGRAFINRDPLTLVAAFAARGLDLPVDINHAEFLRAPKGEEAPAAGWIKELELREGAIWGRVEWTPSGAAALNAKSYRYISPALIHDKAGVILSIGGAGLVNRPNFAMPALNSERSSMKNLLAKLGLAETATENDAIAAVDALQTSLNAAKTGQVSLALYVPRADYDLALNRATTAEGTLETHLSAARAAKVSTLIDGALKAGKIAPATKEFYLGLCKTDDGVQQFETFLAAQPSVFTPVVDPAQQQQGGAVALNAEQTAVAKAMGLDPQKFAEHLAAQAS